MLKKLLIFSIVVWCILFFSLPALAIYDDKGMYGLNDTAQSSGYQTGEKSSVLPVLNRVVGVALSLAATIFFAMALYAGIRWITARGKEDLVTKAREALEAAIIGLIIVSASYAIATFVSSKLLPTKESKINDSSGSTTGGCCTGISTGWGASAMSYCKSMDEPGSCIDAGGTYVQGACANIPGC
ncbi:MAG: hypothetical protein WCX97_04515 [Candidatus Magasanikbacteria bacterium]